MDLRNKTVLVAGTGISGIGAAGLLMRTNADLILYDGNRDCLLYTSKALRVRFMSFR